MTRRTGTSFSISLLPHPIFDSGLGFLLVQDYELRDDGFGRRHEYADFIFGLGSENYEVSCWESFSHTEVLTDLATRGDFDAFELFVGRFTSHNKIALYGVESEDVANLSALDGSK